MANRTKLKKFLSLLPILFIVFSAFGISQPVQSLSPYTTWTVGPGGFLNPSQDAYTPLEEIDLPISGAEEMFLASDGTLYIADTGNGRILKLDAEFQIVAELGVGLLQAPSGLFVDDDGKLYIADAAKDTIVILDHTGALVKEFGRPSEPLFGANREFLPRKISVDARKNLYIVSEGSVNGLVMMNTNGNFIGYFGANMAEMSLEMILRRAFLTQEQLAQFIRNEAASPSNVAIDHQSLVYTITAGTTRDKAIRKFTVSGKNLVERVFGSRTFRDIHVSPHGLMLAVDSTGAIYEYDLNGSLLFMFGGQDRGDQRLGLLSNPSSIERVGDNIYVLDKDKNAIITYRVTDFAKTMHDGVRLYTEGFYAEAQPYFEEVLNYNGLVLTAYLAIANAHFKAGDYVRALEAFRNAEDRDGYSETFWELRNAVLQESLANALGLLFGGWIVMSIFTRVERRYRWLDPLRRFRQHLLKIRLVDDFAFMFRFIRQPADSFYYIKQDLRGSVLFAALLYLWVLIVRILTLYLTGFVFNPFAALWQIQVETEITYTLGLLLLWNVANYLVATISDGEGRLRHVFVGSAYCLFPYALFALPIALLSNLLTLNEVFLYTFSSQLMLLWVGVMLVIMVKEVHNYSVNETIRTLLLTLFTMAMFLLTAYILYVLFNQLYEFVQAVVQEVRLNA